MAYKLKRLGLHLKDFWRYRYLLANLIGRDFKLKYRRSVLGVVWSVLNPLLMMLVMWVIFSQVMDTRGSGIENFPVYLMIGQLLFGFFNEATSSAMGSILGASALLRKVYIPKYIFPLERACFALVNCLFSFIALLLVMVCTGAPFHPTLLLAPYPLLTLFVFSLGVGLALAALTVFFRDIAHLWGIFTTALMYFSAIFYNPDTMGSPKVQALIRFNPVYWYITSFRRVALDGQLLGWDMVLVCGGCALAALAIGFLIFRRNQDKFVLYI